MEFRKLPWKLLATPSVPGTPPRVAYGVPGTLPFKYADAHGFTPIYSEAPFSVTAQGVRPSLQPYFVQTGLEFSA